jgi:hypothetical protein
MQMKRRLMSPKATRVKKVENLSQEPDRGYRRD